MKKWVGIWIAMLIMSTDLFATNVCGDVSGIWEADGSPYTVICDLTIQLGQTLQIEPGVRIEFMGHFRFNVYGTLVATGTVDDSIYFTRAIDDNAYNWWGIRFHDTSSDGNLLEYCVIEYVYKGSGNTPDHNGGGVYCELCMPTFSHCTLRHNSASRGGGLCALGAMATMEFCDIYGNDAIYGGGLFVDPFMPIIVNHCTISHNDGDQGGGVYGSAHMNNCIVSFSEGTAFENGTPICEYGCLYGNSDGINGPFGELIQTSINGDSCDIFFNILLDPQFLDSNLGSYSLQQVSPCINAGDPLLPLDPDGSHPDIGAHTYLFYPVTILEPNGGESLFIFSSDTIRWSLSDQTAESVFIELNRHFPIGQWEIVSDTTENDGEFEWFVNEPLSDSCRIRVCTIDGLYCDVSDAEFSVVSSQGYLAIVTNTDLQTYVLNWNIDILDCGFSASETFRLKNIGSDAIVVFPPQDPPSSEFSMITTCGSFFSLAPGQVSTCTVDLTFAPTDDGIAYDTLLIQTDAVNQVDGCVRFPLVGEQVTTPAAPELVVAIEGENARVSWDVIDESVGGCAIDVVRYLLFFSENTEGPYWFLSYTTDTTFVHAGAVSYAADMFYQGLSTTMLPSEIEAVTAARRVTMAAVKAEMLKH